MDWKYVLLEYDYSKDCQGTTDWYHGYALIHLPKDATFIDARSALFNAKHRKYDHEIDIDSVEDCTIEF